MSNPIAFTLYSSSGTTHVDQDNFRSAMLIVLACPDTFIQCENLNFLAELLDEGGRNHMTDVLQKFAEGAISVGLALPGSEFIATFETTRLIVRGKDLSLTADG